MALPAWVWFAAFLCLLPTFALASDRPYLAATNAVADDDDDNVAALETWLEWSRRLREFRFEPEYNFDPRNAVRIELGTKNDRSVEVEVKHLFTDLARSGFGSGLIVGVDWDNRSLERQSSSWALGAAGLLT